VTAREMFNIIKAAEAGHTGDPHAFRDFVLSPPAGAAANPSKQSTDAGVSSAP